MVWTIEKKIRARGYEFSLRETKINPIDQVKSHKQNKNYCFDEVIFKCIKEGIFKGFLLKNYSRQDFSIIIDKLCRASISSGKKAVILSPETAKCENIFAGMGNDLKAQACIYNSDKNINERFEDWYDILQDQFSIIVGTRSSIFLPFKKAGFILIDEEHDTSYKESSIVRYNTQDIALRLCRILKIPVIFMSNTPSIRTFYLFKNKPSMEIIENPLCSEQIYNLKKEIVDLKKIDQYREDLSITSRLFKQIKNETDKNNNALIFVNRRGYSNVLICKKCGNIPKCPKCNISYTFHKDNNILKCHHCSKSEKFSGTCVECRANDFFYKGIGTEKIESKLKQRFPKIPVFRLDNDTLQRKKQSREIIDKAMITSPAIIIGTKAVVSNILFNNITVTGVIDFDNMVQAPDFHTNERAFQLLEELSFILKKTGSSSLIIQAFNTGNPVLRYFVYKDYEYFYKKEIENRQELFYPPYSSIVNIIFSSKDEKEASNEASRFSGEIQGMKKIKNLDFIMLGPSPAPYYKINYFYRWHIMIKTKKIMQFNIKLASILRKFKKKTGIKIIVDVDPVWIL